MTAAETAEEVRGEGVPVPICAGVVFVVRVDDVALVEMLTD